MIEHLPYPHDRDSPDTTCPACREEQRRRQIETAWDSKAMIIETAWGNYRRHVLYDAPNADVALLQIAFFAGARAATFAAEIGNAETIASMRREINKFQVEVESIARGEK
jgi:hypothetical protein